MESLKKLNVMGVSKLGRSQSSLSRSPTIKANIGSLSDLSGFIESPEKSKEKFGKSLFSEMSRASKRSDVIKCQQHKRFEIQSFLTPLLLVILPFMWLYVKASSGGQSWSWLAYIISLRFWLEVSVAFLFLLTLLLCAKVCFLYTNVSSKLQALYILRAAVMRSWGCLNILCSRPISVFMTEEKNKKNMKSGSPVVWTIGSKSKTERSKVYGGGVQRYSNGDSYEGEFYQGKRSGTGVYYFHMSGKYEGDWVDGRYDGYGVETWFRGSRYRGQYRQGVRDGYGIYRFHTGDVYSGEWSNGQSNGNGVQTCEDGSRYVGEFKNGMKHGFGYYHFRNRDTYAGEYFADKMHGYGLYHFKNGHLYEGAWHEGREQGLGLYTFRNGETREGYWHNGVLETPSTMHPAPGSPMAVSHSKVLNVVQEARRAAAKALEVRRVDDRVNKAVIAANKAANAARIAAIKAVQKNNSNYTSLPV